MSAYLDYEVLAADGIPTGYDIACPYGDCGNTFTISAIPKWNEETGDNRAKCFFCGRQVIIEDWDHAYD